MARVFVTAADVAAILEYPSASAFLRRRLDLEHLHGFPPPAPLSDRPLKWRREAVEEWRDRQGLPEDEDIGPALEHGLASGTVALLAAARTP